MRALFAQALDDFVLRAHQVVANLRRRIGSWALIQMLRRRHFIGEDVDAEAVAGRGANLARERQGSGAIGAEVGREDRAVREADVVLVAAMILRDDFPVARDTPSLRPEEFGAAGAAVENHVEVPCHVAEEVLERRRVRIEIAEDQTLVSVDARDRRQSPFLLVDFVVVDRRLAGHRGQAAVAVVGPAVVAALKAMRDAAILLAYLEAAMAARVEMRAKAAVAVARHEHGLLAHERAQK